MRRKYPPKDIKILYGLSASRCAKCRELVIKDATELDRHSQIGIIAHIVAHSTGGSRGDPNFSKKDTYENWILLCGNCHKIIDDQENTYTVENLREMKKNHEKWVKEKLDEGLLSFGVPELEIAIKHIKSGNFCLIEDDADEFNKNLEISKKIDKNKLSGETKGLIKSGISRRKEVQGFFKRMESIEINFIDPVKIEFKQKYQNLKKQGLDGDSIFFDMINFAEQGTINYPEKAASLAVLCYLFEICEVFEK
jgi:5-methylcytosine-specific restriction endonuclease McrA